MTSAPRRHPPATAAAAATPAPARGRPVPGAPLVLSLPQPAARLRLVCFPHSGAGPTAFHRWAQRLAPAVEVWTAVPPGRATRAQEPFADRWEPLVEGFADAVAAQVPQPYALFGQSLGAAVAFEVARCLARRGAGPVHLVSSASAAPDLRERPPVPAGDDELIEEVGRRYAGIPAEVLAVPELVDFFLPALRADLELGARYAYRPGPPLAVPVTAFVGDQDRSVPDGGLEGWRRHTAAGCETHLLEGGHFALDNHEEYVLDVLRRRLLG
jgi:surfactin synthase thioesterase subunit